MANATVSLRQSIRWPPDEACEPTNTVVLTGAKTGVFLDVRFLKEIDELDWAFAGYHTSNIITFTHYIDSRTLDIVEDSGTNTSLPDGTTLETGEMINPLSGKIAYYEEIWRDEDAIKTSEPVLFIRNAAGTSWRARAGNWQLALGRRKSGAFWAWQAERSETSWVVKSSTENTTEQLVKHLPEGPDTKEWREGLVVEWEGEKWAILERGI